MTHAYTPGLKIAAHSVVRRERRLPLKGSVLVEEGAVVTAETVVARTELPGAVHSVNVGNKLGIDAADIEGTMLVKLGGAVNQGEPMARGGGLLGFFKTEVPSPVDGSVESISKVTGQVLVRAQAVPVTVEAYIEGTIERVLPEEGVIVRANASLVQGIFGIGGETRGIIKLVTSGPEQDLDASCFDESCRGAVVVGGSLARLDAIRKAAELGVAAIVAGGIGYQDLKELLGYSIGVAVTGEEDVGITVVVTEGFGAIPMARHTWELLAGHEGREASVNGATQIRAGVIRPEIVVPGVEAPSGGSVEGEPTGVTEGSPVRIIREPWFGALGEVAGLPPEPRKLDTEASVRIVDVRLADGQVVTVPRANIEQIES